MPVKRLPVIVAVLVPVLLAGCGSSSPPAAYKACEALAHWEQAGNGSTTLDGGEGEVISADGMASPAFEQAFAKWMDEPYGASQYALEADVAAVNGVCAQAGVKDAIPQG